jgi:hypothetical protein
VVGDVVALTEGLDASQETDPRACPTGTPLLSPGRQDTSSSRPRPARRRANARTTGSAIGTARILASLSLALSLAPGGLRCPRDRHAAVRAGLAGAGPPGGVQPPLPAPQEPATPPRSPGRADRGAEHGRRGRRRGRWCLKCVRWPVPDADHQCGWAELPLGGAADAQQGQPGTTLVVLGPVLGADRLPAASTALTVMVLGPVWVRCWMLQTPDTWPRSAIEPIRRPSANTS